MPIQAKTYRVFLKDKGDGVFALGSELYKKADSSLSDRCKLRRKYKSSYSDIVRYEDAPINADYKRIIEKAGAKILLQLKWNNYLVVEADSSAIQAISKLDFVKTTQATSSKLLPLKVESSKITRNVLIPENSSINSISDCGEFHYGFSENQITPYKIDTLHKLGITGSGIIMGFLDSGFRWKAHKSTNMLNVIKEFDFIYNDSITSNQDIDTNTQDKHGSQVLSVACGYLPGVLMGAALQARQYCLQKPKI